MRLRRLIGLVAVLAALVAPALPAGDLVADPVQAQECPNITPAELAALDPNLVMWWAYWTYGPGIFDEAAAAGVTDAQGFVVWLLGQLCV